MPDTQPHAPISEPDLTRESVSRLEDMADAAQWVIEAYRVLNKSKTNIVAEILRGTDTFYQWDHYPENDVYDWESHAQYYYHAHSPEDREGDWIDEHGHFHTFLRPKGMPEGVTPADVPDAEAPDGDNDALSHLIAISMNKAGFPARFFTVNRWVTGETWYHADDVIRMLERFEIDLALPSWPVNVWITNVFRLYRPTFEALIKARDATITAAARNAGEGNVYDDQGLEITSFADVAVDQQISALNDALATHGSTVRVGARPEGET